MAAQQPYIDHLLSSLSQTLTFLHSQNIITLQQKNIILDQLPHIPSSMPTGVPMGANTTRENSIKPWQQKVAEPSPVQPLRVTSPAQTVSSPTTMTSPGSAPGGGGGYMPPTLPALQHAPVPPPPQRQAPPAANVPTCKAKWDYGGQQADDLSFKKGDTIVIEKEENEHWWRGHVMGFEGHSGLFPSNHVEKLPFTPAPAPIPVSQPAPPQYYGGGAYPPPMDKNSGYSAPPYGPPGGYQVAAPAPAPAPAAPQKESVGSKYGNTLKHSLVGGVGFGAGSAVGSGIINSIF
ncbi:SH3-domain-containing protein [Atractiella rhizophila]|nr:SH3-domain-containing protein [Atractiella rhizophila]